MHIILLIIRKKGAVHIDLSKCVLNNQFTNKKKIEIFNNDNDNDNDNDLII